MASRFLQALFRDAPSHHFVELRVMHPERPPQRGWWVLSEFDKMLAQLSTLTSWSASTSGSALFFSPHPRDCAQGCNSDVPKLYALIADIDAKNSQTWAELPGKLLALKTAGLAPSAIIDSGHGKHLYWFLKSGEPAFGNPSPPRAAMFRLGEFLGGDCVHDPARVLRLPGTFNWKKTDNPAECKVLELHPRRRFTSAEISGRLNEAGVENFDLPPSILKMVAGCQRRMGRHIEGSVRRVLLHVPPHATLVRLPGLPPLTRRIAALIVDGHVEGDGYPSRSEADQAVVTALFRAGLSFERICDVFDEYAIGAKYHEAGDAYLHRCFTNALSWTTPGCAHVTARSTGLYDNNLPEQDGRRAVRRLGLALEIMSPDEPKGRYETCRFNVPSVCGDYSWLRWNAVWMAIGHRPPNTRTADLHRLLVGKTFNLEVELVGERQFKVSNFLPPVYGAADTYSG